MPEGGRPYRVYRERNLPGLLDTAALGTIHVPVLGDVMGLLADANMFINEPESRTIPMGLLAAAGMLPLVPNAKLLRHVPMDQASRVKRAEEQGFKTRTFHQTSSERADTLEEFDPRMFGEKKGPEYEPLGVFSRERPATITTGDLFYEGDVAQFPLRIRADKMISFPSPESMDRWVRTHIDKKKEAKWLHDYQTVMEPLQGERDSLLDQLRYGDNLTTDREIELREALSEVVQEIDDLDFKFAKELRALSTQAFLDEGIEVVRIVNSKMDRAEGGTGDVFISLKPENVRSEFAEFHPDRKGSRNILAGSAAVGVGLGLLRQEERDDRPR